MIEHTISTLLTSLFTPEEFLLECVPRLSDLPGGDGLRDALPSPLGPRARFFGDAAAALHRRGLISADALFAALQACRPRRAAIIQACQTELSARQPSAGPSGLLGEDADGEPYRLRSASFRLVRPVRWSPTAPVYLFLERLQAAIGLSRNPIPIGPGVWSEASVQLEYAGNPLDPLRSLTAQGVPAAAELNVVAEVTMHAPYQPLQVTRLRSSTDDDLRATWDAALDRLGFRLAV